ncbi:MAG: outer membrane beta-barrel protein [Gammaproteobacteria bacterium]|nr:outer membrane beta-barrel protein [Gammaproteobacteria bacterium]
MKKLMLVFLLLPAVAFANLNRGVFFGGTSAFVNPKNHFSHSGWRGVRGFAGYQFNKNIALEAGYASLGRSKTFKQYEYDVMGSMTTYLHKPFFAFIKAGVANMCQKIKVGSYYNHSHKLMPVAAMGLGFQFFKYFSTSASWTRYIRIGDIRKIDFIGINLTIHIPT